MPQPEDVNVQIQREKEIQEKVESLRKEAVEIQNDIYFSQITKERGLKQSQEHAAAVAKSRQNFIKKTEGGHEITLTDEVTQTANRYLGEGSQSVYTAITYQLEYTKLIAQGYAALGYLFKLKGSEPSPKMAVELVRMAKDKIQRMRRTDVKLPEMDYSLELSEGKLQIQLMPPKLDDNLDPGIKATIDQRMAALQNHFKDLVHTWLNKNGFQERMDPNNQGTSVFVNNQGKILGEDDLQELKRFLKDITKLNLEDNSPSLSSPRPS